LTDFLDDVCWREEGQEAAEYAVMGAVILVIAIGTIRLIGSHARAMHSPT
jgi:Flp pilus assembly pilin Flp